MKVCSKCLHEKPETAFSRARGGRLHSYCKDCHSAYDRDLYRSSATRRTTTAERNKLRRVAARLFVRAHLRNHPCVDCGEPDPVVLEFDHVRGRKHCDVSVMSGRGAAIATLQREIDKCEVRCANCHKRATHKRRFLGVA